MSSVKGTRPITATNTPFNAISYMIETKVKGLVNTAIPVRVETVELGGVGDVGYVSATPLITQTDGNGNALEPQVIPRLPYCRIQGGKAALIIDPIPGDIGIALFAQQDISSLKQGIATAVTPGSFRSFDMSDGIYIGGILNTTPEIYLELTQDGNANLTAPTRVTIESPEVIINAPSIVLNGNVSMTGTGTGDTATISGDISLQGSMDATGQISSTGIGLNNHVHGGVQSGSETTSGPR